MKNSEERIALPDFAVSVVRYDGNLFYTDEIDLASYVKNSGQGLILYFYPKDNTQGCSIQATDFTALSEEFAKQGYAILGISRDSIKSHQNFIHKKELGIKLISDPDERLCQHFGVIQEKMMYGKMHLGVARSTFIFDKQGIMTASYRNVKAKHHAEVLLNLLKSP